MNIEITGVIFTLRIQYGIPKLKDSHYIFVNKAAFVTQARFQTDVDQMALGVSQIKA